MFSEQAGRPKCPLDPYFIMPDKCTCVDFQVLKLQELNDSIPQGEMPRHLQLYADRYVYFNLKGQPWKPFAVSVMLNFGIYQLKFTKI